jgi:excisionase family DNA binding protein
MDEPETYLRTRQVAEALGVSVSTVKRWIDDGKIDATRTVGKHRLVPLSGVVRFAKREKFPAERLVASFGKIAGGTCEALAEALRAGRSAEARTLIVAAHRAAGAVALGDDLIRPVMERVGHGWMVGAWDVYQEHRAGRAVAAALLDLIAAGSREAIGKRPLALGATPQGDNYVLPGLLCELTLVEGDWEVQNLGVDLPLRSLAAATRDLRPRLAYLSASHLADPDHFIQEYAYFYEAASRAGTAIIVGGRGLDAELRSRLVYASSGERMAHLAEFARRLLAAPVG